MSASTFDKRAKSGERGQYFSSHVSKLHPCQEELIELTRQHPRGRMLGSADSIVLLCNMIKFAGAKNCIDIGVFTGYSSLSWALTIPDDGKVIACDISAEFPKVGMPLWKEAGVDQKIDLRIAPATQTLQSMLDNGESGTYDFIFIDADKTGYDDYYELGLKLLRKDGVIAVDNCWWSGHVLNTSTPDEETVCIQKLNDKIAKDERVTAVLIDTGDGVFIVRKN